MKKYQPTEIENKWQSKWQESGIYKTDLAKENTYYVLAEFAYPSGDLHVGHWFTWGGADIFARFKRMQGYNVFFPNGFDSFGLPAEGAAIKRGIHPKDWTESNIERMKEQYGTLGGSFDFYKDLATHEPRFYKWNQWLFIKMYEKGLAYRGKYLANWCPKDQTVLANEAIEGGKCWRCGEEVIQKEVEQWFFKITDYADRLIWPEDPSVDWPKSVREAQNDWIGKSDGLEIEFQLKEREEKITVYTVFPETIFGVTFLVVAPEHPLVDQLVTSEQKNQVEEYITKAKKKSELERKTAEKDKTGVFTGSFVINPVNKKEVPVWIADYVIPGYGTGAVMGVPGSDHRDFEFANKYDLEIIRVIGESANDTSEIKNSNQVLEEGVLVNSEQFNGLKTPTNAREEIKDYLISTGVANRKTQYHLHDWSISRQRYWGTPIPMIHCSDCGIVPVSEADLPVVLPYEVDYQPQGKSPLESNEEFIKVKCPKCGKEARRDPDTMDTFVDSSWYYFRFLNPDLENEPFDTDLSKKIMPIDIYFGGAEHTLGHTLYSRFITKVFKDLGLTELEEYALKRVNHGIVLGPDGNKMSKSKGNVVNPDDEVKRYGSDAVRIHVSFFMPYDGVGPWISERIWGPYHFLERVWELIEKIADVDLSITDLIKMHQTIRKVTDDISEIKFNTAIATLMEWLNFLSKKEKVSKEEYQTLLKLLAPFAPHITEELWEKLEMPYSVHLQKWPQVDEKYLIEENINIPVQVGGKVRDILVIPSDKKDDQEFVEELAKGSEKVQKFIEGKEIKKVIYISGKMISFVI